MVWAMAGGAAARAATTAARSQRAGPGRRGRPPSARAGRPPVRDPRSGCRRRALRPFAGACGQAALWPRLWKLPELLSASTAGPLRSEPPTESMEVNSRRIGLCGTWAPVGGSISGPAERLANKWSKAVNCTASNRLRFRPPAALRSCRVRRGACAPPRHGRAGSSSTPATRRNPHSVLAALHLRWPNGRSAKVGVPEAAGTPHLWRIGGLEWGWVSWPSRFFRCLNEAGCSR